MPRKTRNTSRARERARLLDAAARVDVPRRTEVCVLGGGAAGLVAAITAAEAGAQVVVLERDLACGRTILATGNGRCNLANTHLDPAVYNDPTFVRAVCGSSWLDDVHDFFLGCGLLWAEEGEGRLYPLSRQAASVREALLERARRAGVVLAPAREVQAVLRDADGFAVTVAERTSPREERGGAERLVRVGRVVVAIGGNKTLDLARDLGLRARPLHGLLCPLGCTGADLAALDGRRVHAVATLVRNGNVCAQEAGEVLFRSYGVSGIVIFNLSRHTRPHDELVLDLLPGVSLSDARALGRQTLYGILDPVIADVLQREAGGPAEALRRAKELRLRVTGIRADDGAQVRRGGLVCEQFDPRTLEAHELPGLHACGEALDVDGPCGGFNLAWAWKSGMVAGAAAAARISTPDMATTTKGNRA